MKKKYWISGLAALVILGGGAAFTLGGEEGSHSVHPAEGGTWDYGASGGRTWSNFQNDKPHSASVRGHTFVDTGCVKGGEWARAETASRWVSILRNEQDKKLC